MRFNPEVTVAAIVERERRFLLVEERIEGRLVLNQPAGHLEDRETILDAAIREAREETGWRFTPEALVGIYLWRNPANERTFLRFAFCGVVDDHRPEQPLDAGIVRAAWFTHEQLRVHEGRLRSPLVLRCIDDYFAGRRQPLDTVASLDLESALAVGRMVV